MRLNAVLTILLLAIFVSGCSFLGGKTGDHTIKVSWERIERPTENIYGSRVNGPTTIAVNALTLNEKQSLPVEEPKGYEYHYEDNPLDSGVIQITASSEGGDYFDFAVTPPGEFEWERLSGNRIILSDGTGKEGTVTVTQGTTMTEVPFVVFDSGGIVNTEAWEDMSRGYSFSYAEPTDFSTGDIRMEERDSTLYAPYGVAIVEKGPGFWGNFPLIGDVRNLTYSQGGIPSDAELFNNIYVFRTADGGYAKVIFTAIRMFRGDAMGFVFDYSQDGLFTTY